MTDTDYMKAKNKILREYIGIDFDLVPEDQVENCPEQYELKVDESTGSCPYCLNYLDEDCEHCPMAKADNECTVSEGNTWEKYIKYCRTSKIPMHCYPESPAYEPMKKLIEQYNKELSWK